MSPSSGVRRRVSVVRASRERGVPTRAWAPSVVTITTSGAHGPAPVGRYPSKIRPTTFQSNPPPPPRCRQPTPTPPPANRAAQGRLGLDGRRGLGSRELRDLPVPVLLD